MTRHSARLGALLTVATFLGGPPAGLRASEGAGYTPFERASAKSIGMIATQDLAVGGCTASVTPTMEVELDKKSNKTGGTAWLVLNQCDKELVVTVLDFKLNNVADVPVKCKSFPKGSGDFSVKVAPGEVGAITCRVKPGNDGEHKYKYSVKYDTTVIDPDIIIKRR
jgi:hypothetical protein